MQDFEVQVLELRVQAALGEARPWNGWRYFNNDKKWVKYFLKVEISPMNGKILVDALWQRNDNLERGVLFREEFWGMPGVWTQSGYSYYWKLQIEERGYRIHFSDLQVSNLIPTFSVIADGKEACCQYPVNKFLGNSLLQQFNIGGGLDADFERSPAATFVRDFPCSDPCAAIEARWLFECDVGSDGKRVATNGGTIGPMPADFPSSCSSGPSSQYYRALLWPNCDVFDFQYDPNAAPPHTGHIAEWCYLFFEENVVCELTVYPGAPPIEDVAPNGGFYRDSRCPNPVQSDGTLRGGLDGGTRRRRSLEEEATAAPKRRARMRRSATGTRKGEVSGKLADRRKARHESFLFNHRYLHPVCWELEDIMYNNQNSEHFPALFYWCYDALWCYSETEVCGTQELVPRHVYEARMNACLGVRGTVWTDLQIKEVLLNNFTNSTFDLNITNGTIYAVAPVPPSELVDDSPSFLTRLPLYASLFGNPNCSNPDSNFTYNGCFFAEGLPPFMNYRYKNFEYLRDWIDGVNYNAYLQQRRREYGIPITKFDFKRYCDFYSHLCDPNAVCESRRKWPGYRCRCKESEDYYGDGYFCTKAAKSAFVKFQIRPEVKISDTLTKIAERFENLTGIPREALDISASVDVAKLEASILAAAGEPVELTMRYPTKDEIDTSGFVLVTDETEKITGMRSAIVKRMTDAGDPPSSMESINVDQWLLSDIEIYKKTVAGTDEYMVKYPAPSFGDINSDNFQVTITDDDGVARDVSVAIGDDATIAAKSSASGFVQKTSGDASASTGENNQPESEAVVVEETQLPPPSSEDVVEAKEPAVEPSHDGEADVATPMLVAGGSVAGVLLLAIVGWTMHKRSSPAEKEAAVMAVHDLGALQHTTVEVESSRGSEDLDEAPRQAQQVKDRWRTGKAGAEDSFTLAQDRSGIWK